MGEFGDAGAELFSAAVAAPERMTGCRRSPTGGAIAAPHQTSIDRQVERMKGT
jgi:hypothetical protein